MFIGECRVALREDFWKFLPSGRKREFTRLPNSTQMKSRAEASNLISIYVYEPFSVETLGPWGPSTYLVFRNISKRSVNDSRHQRTGLFFSQRISIVIQHRGNAASLLGTFPVDIDADGFFDAF